MIVMGQEKRGCREEHTTPPTMAATPAAGFPASLLGPGVEGLGVELAGVGRGGASAASVVEGGVEGVGDEWPSG